jgi:hypothetical protein
MNIDVFTFIVGNGADYAEYMKYTCDKFLSGKHKINWKCVESLEASRLPNGFECVGKSGGEDEHNAMKHALAIEEALKHIESEYVLITDSDIAVVYPEWDDVIVQNLKKYHCFGGSYASSKKSRYTKNRYKNFPKANFFSFRSSILKKVDLNFRPFNDMGMFKGRVCLDNCDIFNIKEGKEIAYDIGWRLPYIFFKHNLKSFAMPCYFQNHNKSKLPYLNEEHRKFCNKKTITMEEWHYNNELFATHKKHCRHEDLNSQWGLAWKTRVDLYINRGDWYEKNKVTIPRKPTR